MRHVVVIGAGAAGIFASISAARAGARVTLLEKTPRLGTKILISGGGKCNITHAGTVEKVLKGFKPTEQKFLRPSLYRYTNEDVLAELEANGLEVYAREDGRIFPLDGNAKDVVAILDAMLQYAGVEVHLEEGVTHMVAEGDVLTEIKTERRSYQPDFTILAVGGSSYPKSGTTGDGYRWMRELGHSIVPVRGALAPIDIIPDSSPIDGFGDHMGIALRDVILMAKCQGKEVARWRDDLLITHSGISGPTALGISREVAEAMVQGKVELEIDLRPNQKFEQLQNELLQIKRQTPTRLASLLVRGLVPDRLQEDLAKSVNLDTSLTLQQTPDKRINILTEACKRWPLGTVKQVPIEKGEVVAGGVSLDEVDPQTMLSTKVKCLALCGEVLDVAGAVGGYNLQAAFSTGWVAGETAASPGSAGSQTGV